MNHGKCANCYWYKWGHCFMQGVKTNDSSYCPDYHNRNKEKETLEQLINHWVATGKYSLSELNKIKNHYAKGNQH